jgi:hypothetical protein
MMETMLLEVKRKSDNNSEFLRRFAGTTRHAIAGDVGLTFFE